MGSPARRILVDGGGGAGVLSALLLLLAQPPFGLFPLAFVSLVPLALAIARQPEGPEGRWASTRVGMVFGVIFWGTSLLWMPAVVGSSFAWALPGYLLIVSLLTGLSGGFAWLTHLLFSKSSVPLGLALPLAWVAVEWMKASVPWGLAFPWMGLALTLTEQPEFLGIAEWVGEEGVAFWIAGVNGLAAGLLMEGRRTSSRLGWAGVAAALLIPGAVGGLRSVTLPLDEGPRLAVVGTQVPRELRRQPVAAWGEAHRQIDAALAQVAPGSVDLVVLPEAALPFSPDNPAARESLAALAAWSADLKAPLVFGGLGAEPVSGELHLPTNSAYLMDPGGSLTARYDKQRLVPGMEAGRYRRGDEAGVFPAGEWNAGILICYESIFGSLSRSLPLSGAQIVLNLSSDVWFGDPGSLVGDFFLPQHPAHLVLRAVENRMPVARAGNRGSSLVLDPLGRRVVEAGPSQGGLLEARAPFRYGITLYTRIGGWIGPLVAAMALVLLFRPRPSPRLSVSRGKLEV